jgi:acetolactate synthase-1/2/3 large subunit
VTAGPGASNAITGLLSALSDSVPLFILAGQVKTQDIDTLGLRTHGVQEIRSREIITPAVKSFYSLRSLEEFPSMLKSIHTSYLTGRKGPIFIEVPLDLQSMGVENAEKLIKETLDLKMPSEKIEIQQLKEIENLIRDSKRISIMFGNGVRIAGLNIDPFLILLNEKKIPRFYTWLSQDLEDYSDENNLHCPGSLAPIYSNKVLQESDLVIFLGTRLDLATVAFQREKFGAASKRIIVDIDPLELSKFSEEFGDTKVLYDLKNGLEFIMKPISETETQLEWQEQFTLLKHEYLQKENLKLRNASYSTRDLAHAISDTDKDKIIVMSSSGYAAEGFARFFKKNGNTRFFHGGGLGAMGQGLSHGIGAITARFTEQTPVWIVESDGGLWMNVHELATLKHLNAQNVILVIMNNHGYSSIRNSQERHFDTHFGTGAEDGLLLPDWSLICESLGLSYEKVRDPRKFNFNVISRKIGTLVLDVELKSDENRGPSLKTIMSPLGPVTQAIGEIDW